MKKYGNNFHKAVCETMRLRGVGVRELGRMAGVDPNTVSRFLRGRNTTYQNVEKMCGALGIELESR